ncbi:alpha/beta hydrolase [Candidatus Pacearchaeota archaeon]|nr:alpha/beta hydrolase [Candidatus Pacearchaeota archaeon]
MFGVTDRIYTFSKKFKKYRDIEVDWKPEISLSDKYNRDWYCFVPQNTVRFSIFRNGLIPNCGNVFIYKIYSLNIIDNNPTRTLENLQIIYNDVSERLYNSFKEKKDISFLGVSLGNVLAVRAAGEVGSKIERIVSIAGGGKLGLSAWEGILTSNIAKSSGFRSPEEYEEILSSFSPVHYINKILAKEILIRLGARDLLIPFNHGQELASAFRDQASRTEAKYDCKIYPGSDHSATIFLSALFKVTERRLR